jgi:hypothetical protein
VVRVPRLRIGAKPPKRYQRRRSGHDQALDRLAAAFATLGLRWLHRLIGREELRDLAVGQIRSQLFARLTEDFAVEN